MSAARRRRRIVVCAAAVLSLAGLAVLAAPATALAAAGDLATFAGSLGAGTATSVAMGPRGVAVSGTNLYVADTENNLIRKVDLSTGTASVVAGNGIPGFDGDGGPGTAAQINGPTDVQVDASGNLYVADTNNQRIRKITSGGIISTVAGDGTASGTGTGGNGGPATSAQLGAPRGVAIDSAGNLFINDFAASAIRKVTPGGIISTFASGLAGPRNIAFDSSSNVYVTECTTGDVLKYPAAGGAAVRVAGTGTNGFSGDGGAATAAKLACPIGIAISATNVIYVADNNNSRIRTFTVGGTINSIAGTGTSGYSGDGGAATAANINLPSDLDIDAGGNVFFAQRGSASMPSNPTDATIRKITSGGTISTVAGNTWAGYAGDGAAATSAQLDRPSDVATDSAGNVYIADKSNNRIRKVTTAGTISTVAGTGYPCVSPCGVGNIGDGAAAPAAYLNAPRSVSVATTGDIYIADTGHHRIRKVSGGTISSVAGTGTAGYGGDGAAASAAVLNNPSGVTAAPDGSIYIADTGNNRIRKISGATISTVAGTGATGATGDGAAATAATLNAPSSVAVDSAGVIYIADTGNNRIRAIAANGTIATVAGTGTAGESGDGGLATAATLNAPAGITVDTVGNLYVADTGNQVARRIDPKGIITVVAGTSGTSGFAGDGGAGTGGELSGPSGLAVDPSGNLYLADPNEQRVRRLTTETSAATWWVSDATVNHSGVTYAWDFTPLTATAIGKVAITLTSTTTTGSAGLTVVDAFGIPTGGTLTLSAGVLTYAFAPSVTLQPGQHAFLSIAGFANTATPGFYAGTLTTQTAAAATIDTFRYGAVDFDDPVTTALPAIAPRVTVTTPNTLTVYVSPLDRPDVSTNLTATIATNATNGYTLAVSATPLTGATGTINPVSTGIATAVTPAAFPANRFGYAITNISGVGAGVAQGSLAGGSYAGYTAAGQTAVAATGQAAAGDTVTIANRVRVDYLQPAGTYTSTLTYTVTPSY